MVFLKCKQLTKVVSVKISTVCSDMSVGDSREVFNLTEVKKVSEIYECSVCKEKTGFYDTYHAAPVCSSECVSRLLDCDWANAMGVYIRPNK